MMQVSPELDSDVLQSRKRELDSFESPMEISCDSDDHESKKLKLDPTECTTTTETSLERNLNGSDSKKRRSLSQSQKIHRNKKKSQQMDRRRQKLQDELFDSNCPESNKKVFWLDVDFEPFDLYPNIPKTVNFHQGLAKLSNKDIKEAEQAVQNTFFSFRHGAIAVLDRRKRLIAFIQFTEMEKLTPEEKHDLQFLSQFAHRSKKYSRPVTSNPWGGKKWKIGWRKSMKPNQRIERYKDEHDDIQQNPSQHEELVASSKKASRILGSMMKKMHHSNYEQNHDLMTQNNIPSFPNLNPQEPLSEDDCSPNLTFTSDGYFDMPHVDRNQSQFKFTVFIPQHKVDGTLADPATGYDLTGGNFAFNDIQCGIDFSEQRGIVKMIWNANRLNHCTFPTDKNELYTRLSISLQINSSLFYSCAPDIPKDCCSVPQSKEDSDQEQYLIGLAQLLCNSSP